MLEVQLKSDYFRIEIDAIQIGAIVGVGALKSDYFRIEMDLIAECALSLTKLKSDYFRIEIGVSRLH